MHGIAQNDWLAPRAVVALVAVCTVVLLAGCRGTSPDSTPTATVAPGPRSAPLQGDAPVYRVIAAESLLQIYAYRGGSLSRLGHNHVIAARNLQGTVMVPSDPLLTRLDVTIPVALLTVDEPALRAAAGEDFSTEVPDSARAGTRTNMLGPALLDADRHPGIGLGLLSLTRVADRYDAEIEVTIKSQRHSVRVPLQVSQTPAQLSASGEFALKQSELGLTPFSVMLGALTVQDELRVKFSLVAQRQQLSSALAAP